MAWHCMAWHGMALALHCIAMHCIALHYVVHIGIGRYLRVLARSSPEDKVTLADGLNRSMLFENKAAVAALASEGIVVFPDRQVMPCVAVMSRARVAR